MDQAVHVFMSVRGENGKIEPFNILHQVAFKPYTDQAVKHLNPQCNLFEMIAPLR